MKNCKKAVPAGGRNRTLTYLDDLSRAKSEGKKLAPRDGGIELCPVLQGPRVMHVQGVACNTDNHQVSVKTTQCRY